jgi:hypothetical protein
MPAGPNSLGGLDHGTMLEALLVVSRLRTWLPVFAILAGCGGENQEAECGWGGREPERLPGCPAEPAPVDPDGSLSHWVVDAVQLPATHTLANQLGMNLDCDPQDRGDNALGHLVATVYSQEASDLNDEVAAMIAAGRLLHLIALRATRLDDAAGVGFTLLHGLDADGDPTNNFGGTGEFDIETARGRGTVAGPVRDGLLSLEGDQLPLGLLLPSLDEVVILPIERSRVEAVVVDGRLEGKIGGAVPEAAVDAILIPFLHRALLRAIERDCLIDGASQPPCPCEPDSFGELLLLLLDEEPDRGEDELRGDCVLELDEFRNDSLVSSLLAPDVDVFDDEGELNLRCDGVKDSLSLGVGFTAVPAQF